MAMIIGDYAAGFLGLAEGQFWDIPAFDVCDPFQRPGFVLLTLDRSQEMRLPNGAIVERGRGNHVSVEFNLLYRVGTSISVPLVQLDDGNVLL